ncbi:MAG: sigma factor-like helix-turn-helix DNA-binding protein [Candidatus Merdivicinus sp.]
MPEKQLNVLLFDFWYAWTDEEIAERMEVTTRTVYNLRQRAFKAIRKFYEHGSSEL